MGDRYARVEYLVHSERLEAIDPEEIARALARHPIPLGHLEVERLDGGIDLAGQRPYVPQPSEFGETELSLEQFSQMHRSHHVYRVRACEMEPDNLDYLRSGLLVAGELAALVGGLIVDPLARMIKDAAAVADVIDRGFDPFDHLSLHIDTGESPYWVHTHGMEKFGHADVQVLGVPHGSVSIAERLIRHLVSAVIAGGRFRPGERTSLCGFGFEFAGDRGAAREHFSAAALTLCQFELLEEAVDPAMQGMLTCASVA